MELVACWLYRLAKLQHPLGPHIERILERGLDLLAERKSLEISLPRLAVARLMRGPNKS